MTAAPTAEDQVRLDLLELRDLRGRATRQRVQDLLDLQIRRLETDLAVISGSTTGSADPKPIPIATGSDSDKLFTTEIKTYAWDQSDKYFKLYVSEGMAGVGALDKDRVKADFTEVSVRLLVLGLNGRDRELRIGKLYDKIVPGDSSVRVKKDEVVLMLRKAACSTWAFVTHAERKAKEQKKPKPPAGGDKDDPNAGLMSLMKQMYEDGDDEMKRTIAKAWTESQSKKAAGID